MIKYNILLYLLSPYLILKVIYCAFRRKSGALFILERLGLKKIKNNRENIWIHAASLGETKIAILLYKKLSQTDKNLNFLITTTTSSSYELIKSLEGNIKHCYMPIDWFFTIKAFIKRARPSICILIETEIWPNLIKQCKKVKIPTTIVNARLSKKTTGANTLVKNIYHEILPDISKIYCKTNEEESNYIKLGADPNKISVLGNLKLIPQEDSSDYENIIGKKYVLAASTHRGEERQIITEWLKMKERKILLVIVPRHPERLGDILSDIPLDMVDISIRSKEEPITSRTQIYIADTYGELDGLMKYCEFVFMGGSLVDHGGQNFIEAANQGKSIIVGPYMYNFISETEEFLQKNSMIMVKSSESLKHVFEKLIKSRQRRELFGNNAKKLILSKSGIIDKYCQSILSMI
mgnify:CR=1 FL=1